MESTRGTEILCSLPYKQKMKQDLGVQTNLPIDENPNLQCSKDVTPEIRKEQRKKPITFIHWQKLRGIGIPEAVVTHTDHWRDDDRRAYCMRMCMGRGNLFRERRRTNPGPTFNTSFPQTSPDLIPTITDQFSNLNVSHTNTQNLNDLSQ